MTDHEITRTAARTARTAMVLGAGTTWPGGHVPTRYRFYAIDAADGHLTRGGGNTVPAARRRLARKLTRRQQRARA